MKPVFQTRFGTDGNCWAACIASMFEVPLAEVDHCACNHPDWRAKTEAWLACRGVFMVEIRKQVVDGKNHWPFVAPPNGTLCILSGESANGLLHVVIGKSLLVRRGTMERVSDRAAETVECDMVFELIHDPYPGGIQLKSTEDVIFLGKHFPE